MKRGYVELALRLLIFLGVTGSGKSLFQRLVLGLPFLKDSPSTPLAEPSVRTMSICQVGVDADAGSDDVQWDIVDPKQMMDMVVNTIKERTLAFGQPNTISQLSSLVTQTPSLPMQPPFFPEHREDSSQVHKQAEKMPIQSSIAAPTTEVNIKPQKSLHQGTAGSSRIPSFINPRRACAARVTVVGFVCLSVC